MPGSGLLQKPARDRHCDDRSRHKSSSGFSTTARLPRSFPIAFSGHTGPPIDQKQVVVVPFRVRKQATSLQVIQGDDHCLPWFVALIVLGARRSFNLSAVLVEQIRRLVEMCVIAGSHVLQCIVSNPDRNHGLSVNHRKAERAHIGNNLRVRAGCQRHEIIPFKFKNNVAAQR